MSKRSVAVASAVAMSAFGVHHWARVAAYNARRDLINVEGRNMVWETLHCESDHTDLRNAKSRVGRWDIVASLCPRVTQKRIA